MATIKTDLICNLNQPVNVTYLHGNLFSQDNAGNTINVFVMDNGEPATIGGTVSANVIRSDGQTVAVSGAIEGNKAYVILPQACYAVPGVVHIIIKLTQNTTITTIAAIVANVYMSTTDAVIDPGTVIPSIQALMALIEEAVDSIPTDYTGLLHTIAADYSSSKTYKVGDYAWESGVLKRCIVPITAAETYTAAHWTNAVIGDDLTNLKSALFNNEVPDFLKADSYPVGQYVTYNGALWYLPIGKAANVGFSSTEKIQVGILDEINKAKLIAYPYGTTLVSRLYKRYINSSGNFGNNTSYGYLCTPMDDKTGLIEVPENGAVYVLAKDGYQFKAFMYDSGKGFIASTDWISSDYFVIRSEMAKYVGFNLMITGSSATLGFDDMENIKNSVFIWSTNSIATIAIENRELLNPLNLKNEEEHSAYSRYINSSGVPNPATSYPYICSTLDDSLANLIPVVGKLAIYAPAKYSYKPFLYDANKDFIRSIDWSTGATTISITDAAYVAFNLMFTGKTDALTNADRAEIGNALIMTHEGIYEIVGQNTRDIKELKENFTSEVTACIIGASIEAGTTHEWDSPQTAHIDASKAYLTVALQRNGIAVTNLSRGGMGYVRPSSVGSVTVKDIVDDTDFTGFNSVYVCLGYNDYNHNFALGSHEDEVGAATVCGQLKYVIETIYTSNPEIKLFIKNMGGNGGLNSATVPYTQAQLQEEMKAVCGIYGVEMITLGAIANAFNRAMIYPDGVHPSAEVMALMANDTTGRITYK